MKTHYELVGRPQGKRVDIISRSIPKGEWYFVATVSSLERARTMVEQLNLGAEITDGRIAKRDKPKRRPRGVQ